VYYRNTCKHNEKESYCACFEKKVTLLPLVITGRLLFLYYFSTVVEFGIHFSGNRGGKPLAATLFVASLAEFTARTPIFAVAQRCLLAFTT
jgi:hypothetical protein